MLAYLWMRFLIFGLFGKTVAVIVVLYAGGWLAGTLGAQELGRQLGSAALSVLALLLTTLVIRLLWNSYIGKPGHQ